MSIHNRYADVPLTDEDFTVFDAQFAIIEEIMKALPEPDGHILRRVAKLGFKSDTFTRDALMLAAKHEELLPRGLDVQELEAQVRLRDELKSRALQMKLMARKMEKIVQLLGSDVFSGALAAYKAMKTNHRGTLNEQLRELGRIFRRRKKGEEDKRSDTGSEGPQDGGAMESSVPDPRRSSISDDRLRSEASAPTELCLALAQSMQSIAENPAGGGGGLTECPEADPSGVRERRRDLPDSPAAAAGGIIVGDRAAPADREPSK